MGGEWVVVGVQWGFISSMRYGLVGEIGWGIFVLTSRGCWQKGNNPLVEFFGVVKALMLVPLCSIVNS